VLPPLGIALARAATLHVVAFTEYDIFGSQTNFVFSWQGMNDEHAEGVLSTYRLATSPRISA
jgi:hypothetical protein